MIAWMSLENFFLQLILVISSEIPAPRSCEVFCDSPYGSTPQDFYDQLRVEILLTGVILWTFEVISEFFTFRHPVPNKM
jgi:hypothetical protein